MSETYKTLYDDKCHYCVEGELVEQFALKICELPASKVYLFLEQSHEGRCIVASKYHVAEMIELSDEDRNAFYADVATVARVIHKLFAPDKINYCSFGDKGHHLHVHLVPKYRDGFEWGGTFAMNPQLLKLDAKGYADRIELIKQQLLQNE